MPNKPVPWLKLWPELVDHEKFAQLTDSECWTWVKLLAKSGQQPTRGRFRDVKHAVVASGRPKKHVERLLKVRLLDQRPDGLWLHDWEKWQRWRPEDADNTNGTPTDEPSDELSNDQSSTRDEHAMNTRSTHLRVKSIENRPEETPPNPPVGEGRQSVPKPKRERTVITDQDTEALVEKYAVRYGSPQAVRDEIELALNHQARLKNFNERLYVDGWLRRELEHRPGLRAANGRTTAVAAPHHVIDRTGVEN